MSLILLLIIAALLVGRAYWALAMDGGFRPVVPHQVYRSAQPTPQQLRAWISKYGIKTIVNLRGPYSPCAAEEQALAGAMGAAIIHVELSAYGLIPSHRLVQLIDALEAAEPPILVHCHHGIDRAGTASALAAWLVGGQSYSQAKWQAYVPPGPWKYRNGGDHISDTFDVYEQYCRKHNFNPDDPAHFKYWARHIYHPYYYFVALDGPTEISASPGELIAVPVSVTNRSEQVIPAGDPDKTIGVYAKLVSALAEQTHRSGPGPVTALPRQDLQPGQTTAVIHTLRAPFRPGEYRLVLDLAEVGRTTFQTQGSPALTCVLHVEPALPPRVPFDMGSVWSDGGTAAMCISAVKRR